MRRRLAGHAERDREASWAHTRRLGGGRETSGVLAGGELPILNTNDLFQGGMCKEYTALMWWRGGNAVTSRLPA